MRPIRLAPSPRVARAALSLFALAPLAAAQDVLAPGFAETAHQPAPVAGAAYVTLSSGDRVVFDGQNVDLYDAAGGFVANLASLPSFVFPGCLAVNPAETVVLVGESSNGDVYRVNLAGGGLTLLANLPFNYDAVFLDNTRAVVSAAPCGFGCGTDLVRVSVTNGVTQQLAALPGASGPVALAPNGDLVYATVSGSFPPPPGSTDIVKWTAAQVASGQLLSLADATTLVTGLDGAASLAVDPIRGDVVIAESVFGATSWIKLFRQSGALVSTVVTSSQFLGNVELLAGAGPGHFYPYQPSDGVYLSYHSDEIRTVRPQRPQATFQQAGSVGTVTVTGAHPDGAVLMLFGPQPLWSPTESSYSPFGLPFLFHSGLPLSAVRRTIFLVPTDSAGVATWSYFDPGNLGGTLVFQALVADDAAQFVGSSNGVLN